MCGFLQLFKKNITEDDLKILRAGSTTIEHRGPDDKKEVIDCNTAVIFNRLSIVDLESGEQPFIYEGRYIVVFNGEIYNYKKLREELISKKIDISTNSEVEVIAALYKLIGKKIVEKLRGMFSIIIYDKIDEKIIAFRDHFGIKPLYYMEIEDGIYFSSEMKALKEISNNLTYKYEYIEEYTTFQYIPYGNLTLFNEIKILDKGNILEKKLEENIKIDKYFEVIFNEKSYEKEELKIKIRNTIRESVKAHLNSDVPIATFLSSGIDSSIITKIASEFREDIVSYTVGFDEEGYDESEFASRFSEEIGIKNITIKLGFKDYIRDLPKIIYKLDTPIADPSIVPLYHICKEASKNYKVILSGEGSDEFFGGYNIYTEDESLKIFNIFPKSIKSIINLAALNLPVNLKGRSYMIRGTTPIERRYFGNSKIFEDKEKKIILNNYSNNRNDLNLTDGFFKLVKDKDNIIKRQFIDINTWLVLDILTKADRMSMANSLELRVPFIDKEVFKLASTLKRDDKIKGYTTKYMLREAFKDCLPEYIYKKKKLGYPVPLRVWFKEELYDWAYDILVNNPVKEINEIEIINMLKKHKEGKYDYSRKIWTILTYILWYRLYIDKSLDENYQYNI